MQYLFLNSPLIFLPVARVTRTMGIEAIPNLKKTNETGLSPFLMPMLTAGNDVPQRKAVTSVSAIALFLCNMLL